jgi:glycosyltransferase involved in cell wall biosynthesis
MKSATCWQVNLQRRFGGGEVYTRFLCRALADLGWRTRLVVDARAGYWERMDLPQTELVPLDRLEQLPGVLPAERSLVLTHGGIMAPYKHEIAARHFLCGIAHMPLHGRRPDTFSGYTLVAGVSRYVVDSLLAAGMQNVYPEPLYGVADLAPRPTQGAQSDAIRRTSCYDWDERKFRDRLLGWLEPAWLALRPERGYERRDGITLGIVSRLTTIKQFPLLFSLIAAKLAQHPRFRLEVFGSGGYASVRDLRRELTPLGDRVRFWGEQSDVRRVYGEIDYVMTGLPEREALGLNVLEAQACGTPVLAVAAPPFTETVVDGVTGFFFRDPREDRGADFERLLQQLEGLAERLQPQLAADHLARFSPEAFRSRVATLLDHLSPELT